MEIAVAFTTLNSYSLSKESRFLKNLHYATLVFLSLILVTVCYLRLVKLFL